MPGGDSRADAAAVIERLFGEPAAGFVDPSGAPAAGFRLRLWDGSEVRVGTGEPAFTLVVRDRRTFRRIFQTTRTRAIAEAFIAGAVDIEGDLFAALRVAGALDGRRLGLRDRLAIRWRLGRL